MKDVVNQILTGNDRAFRVIVQEYELQLIKTAWHFFHDWDDARDTAQTTFIRIYKNLHRFQPDQPFENWVFTIHLNVCRTMIRRRKLLQEKISVNTINKLQSSESHDLNDDTELIRSIIKMLPWKQRCALVLMGIEKYPAQEVAQFLGCAESTVRVHLNRARQTVTKKLKTLGIEP